MKDLSLFLLKNSLGAKMRKGFKSFCNGDGSTSTLNQRTTDRGDSSCMVTQSLVDSTNLDDAILGGSQPTLEDMILQLELEEKLARIAKLDEYGEIQHRMSCVNSSDILRSARNALNQYPRFSLDGKDAMYRSSFRNLAVDSTGDRKSICGDHGLRKGLYKGGFDSELEKTRYLPATLAGDSVVWRKPGVVAKLMGLEAIPIPLKSKKCSSKESLMSSVIRKQSLRRRGERHEMVRRRHAGGSCSTTGGYCVLKPVAVELASEEVGWPMRRFL